MSPLRAPFLAGVLAASTVAAYPAIPEVAVMRCPDGGIQPAAIADSKGAVHMVFFKGEPAHGDLFYSTRPPGLADFSEPVRINSIDGAAIAIGTIRGAQLALGSEGSIHVAWMGSGKVRPKDDHHKSPMLYSRSTDGGKTFEPQRNLITEAYGLDGGGAIAADAAGRVEVFWHSGEPDLGEAGRQIWVARSTDNGKTFSPEVPISNTDTGVCGCCGMTAGASGEMSVVLYRSATEGVHRDIYLLKSESHGSDFQSQRLDRWKTPSCPMSSMSVAFAGKRTVLAWEASGGNIAFSIIGSKIERRLPHGNQKKKFPSVALAPDGHLLLAWADGAGWKKGGRLAWQLFDPDGKPVGKPRLVGGNPIWSKPAAVFSGGTFIIVH